MANRGKLNQGIIRLPLCPTDKILFGMIDRPYHWALFPSRAGGRRAEKAFDFDRRRRRVRSPGPQGAHAVAWVCCGIFRISEGLPCIPLSPPHRLSDRRRQYARDDRARVA